MRSTTRLAVGAATVLAAGAAAVPATAYAGDHESAQSREHRRCAAQFERAAQADMATFGNFDLDGWRAVHRPDAVTIFASGRIETSFEATATTLRSHFTDRNATWTYTEIQRRVAGCSTGFILWDATYAIPSIGFTQRAAVGVTWTYQHGKWLVVADQNTLLPAA